MPNENEIIEQIGTNIDESPMVNNIGAMLDLDNDELLKDLTEQNKIKEPEKKELIKKIEKTKFDNPLLADLNIEEEKEIIPIELKSVEDVYSLIKSEAGLDIKEPTQLKEFATKYKTLEADNISLKESKATLDSTLDELSQLPDDVYGILKVALDKGDYLAEMKKLVSDNTLPFDHTLPFEKQDTRKMLEYFYPNEFEEDDFDDMDSKLIKLSSKKAKEEYDNLVKKVSTPKKTNYRESTQKEIEEFNTKFTTSIDNSVKSLSEKSKYFKEEQIGEVKKIMQGGQKVIFDIFFEQDGTWKPDAVKNLLFNKYGENALTTLKDFVSKRTETRVHEDLLKRNELTKGKKENETFKPKNSFEQILADNIEKKNNNLVFE